MDFISYCTFELCTHTMRPMLSGSKQVTEGREIKKDGLLHIISFNFPSIPTLYSALFS